MTAAAPETQTSRWRDLFTGSRARLTIGICVVEFVAAVQGSVVTSIMPSVVHDLKGIEFYGLAFSGYILAGLAATPLAGRAADTRGPARPFLLTLSIFTVGTVLAGFAFSMPELTAARVIQGIGGGAQYTIAYGAMVKAYSSETRAKMLTLLSAAWVVPGLLGPGFGALVAATLGWRWAFFLLLPLVALAAFLVTPDLRRLPVDESHAPEDTTRWHAPVLLAIGTGVVLSGLTGASLIAVPVTIVGLVLLIYGARGVFPAGTFTAQRGLPSTIAVGLLVNLAFFTGWFFLPLVITEVGHRSLAEAGVAITVSSVAWAAGSWWQQRVDARVSRVLLISVAAGALGLGLAFSGAPFLRLPLALTYVGFGLASIAMGILFQCLYLIVADVAPTGGETTAIASLQVTNRLGIALGGGVGGSLVAIAHATHAPVASGLQGAFVIAVLVCVLALALSSRLVQPAPAAAQAA